ncbi:MAG: hypothetical protein PHY64_14450, partial [Eubacteriales bacterium]|nr:hypothetical protein [Eubacteriales bacterium]
LNGEVLLNTVVPDAGPTSTPAPTANNYEYQVPSNLGTDNSYGFTLSPTDTPTPTPPPLDITVEDDE